MSVRRPELFELMTAPAECPECRHTVRGVPGDLCPECGSTYLLVLARFHEPMQYHAAATALKGEGIAMHGAIEHRSIPALVVVSSQFDCGSILVRRSDFEFARHILEDVIRNFNRPIVDRREPVCPHCDSPLEINGPEKCSECGREFRWVDIDEPDVDATGLVCPKCSYDLAGIKSEKCPECGAPTPVNIEALVAVASGEVQEGESLRTHRRDEARGKLATRTVKHVVYGAVVFLGCAFSIGEVAYPQDSPVTIVIGVLLMVCGALALYLSRQK